MAIGKELFYYQSYWGEFKLTESGDVVMSDDIQVGDRVNIVTTVIVNDTFVKYTLKEVYRSVSYDDINANSVAVEVLEFFKTPLGKSVLELKPPNLFWVAQQCMYSFGHAIVIMAQLKDEDCLFLKLKR